jgi:preprotein translocase subunit SecF
MFVSTPVLLYLDIRAGRLDHAEDKALADKAPAGAKAKA